MTSNYTVFVKGPGPEVQEAFGSVNFDATAVDALTDALKMALPPKNSELLKGKYDLVVALNVSINEVHARTDQLLRNYAALLIAIISVHFGLTGQTEKPVDILWIAPFIALAATIQSIYMKQVANQLEAHQKRILGQEEERDFGFTDGGKTGGQISGANTLDARVVFCFLVFVATMILCLGHYLPIQASIFAARDTVTGRLNTEYRLFLNTKSTMQIDEYTVSHCTLTPASPVHPNKLTCSVSNKD